MDNLKNTFVKRKYGEGAEEFLIYLMKNPHPNLPNIIEVKDGYYIMEYVKGRTLSDVENEGGALSEETAKSYMLQLISAVKLMHGFKVVHRDIKPDNIIITSGGILKLIDFDSSRKITDRKTRDTVLLGTNGFAAPEQYGFSQTDERSDIYALGIVYNYMLTKKSPFEQIADGANKKIIKKCISIDKKDRYKNTDILKRDIESDVYSGYKLFDFLPGFRTRNPINMTIAASVYIIYLASCFITKVVIFETEQILFAALFYMADIICLGILAALIFNIGGIADKITIPAALSLRYSDSKAFKILNRVGICAIWVITVSILQFFILNDASQLLVISPIFSPFIVIASLFF